MPALKTRRSGVFGMLHGAAAQHADLDRVVEQHEIGRGLQRRGGEIVFGVEEFRVGQRDVADLAFALDLGAAEVEQPVRRNSASRSSASRLGRSMA